MDVQAGLPETDDDIAMDGIANLRDMVPRVGDDVPKQRRTPASMKPAGV